MGSTRDVWERGQKAFNDHDLEGLLNLYSDDAEFTGPGGMTARGRDQIRQFTQGWFQGFPDAKLEAINVITTDTHVVEEGVFIGTHTGVFPTPQGDIPPTGRAVRGPYMDIFEIRDGKVISDHLSFDRMELMEQLGLVPQPAAAAG